jgi:catechol 2,3-dioxygenase-like lactoylglutathione lyase family enzyme
MAITGVHHVGILVSDLPAAERFATEVLGLPVVRRVSLPEEDTEAVFVECGRTRIELIGIDDPELRRRRARLPEAAAEIEHLALAVDDVEEEAGRLRAQGIRFAASAVGGKESDEPLEVAGTRSFFSLPETSAGLTWQLIEDRG